MQETDKQLRYARKRLIKLREKAESISPDQYRRLQKYEQAVAMCRQGIAETEAIIRALERPHECDYVPASALADYAGLQWEQVHELARLGELGEQYDRNTRLFPRSDLERLRNINWYEASEQLRNHDLGVYFRNAVAALAAGRMEEFRFNILRLERRSFASEAERLLVALQILRDWTQLPFGQLTGPAKSALNGAFIPRAGLDALLRKGVEVIKLTDEETISHLKRQFPWAERALLGSAPEPDDEAPQLKIKNLTPQLASALNDLIKLAPSLNTIEQLRLSEILKGVARSFRVFW